MPEPHVIHDRRGKGEGGWKNEEEEDRAEGVAESRKVLVSWNKLLPASARERNKFSPEISPRLSRVPLPAPRYVHAKFNALTAPVNYSLRLGQLIGLEGEGERGERERQERARRNVER